MTFRRYLVTAVTYGVHRERRFWTLEGARRWRNKQRPLAGVHTYLFWRIDGRWVEMS